MKHPNLIIPGFPKSGTTSLHNILCQHKDITGVPIQGENGFRKEPHTYTFDLRYTKRAPVACNEKYLIHRKYFVKPQQKRPCVATHLNRGKHNMRNNLN